MVKQPLWLIIGLLLTYYGYHMATGFVSWRGVLVSGWVGYFAIQLGLVCIVSSFFMKKDKTFGEATICPHCLTPYPEDLLGTACPKCATPLENMEGFYDRHPELKEAARKADDNAHTE